MDSQIVSSSSSFSLELRLMRARNIFLNSSKEIFVRFSLSTASNRRVRTDSQQISSDSNNLSWNQTFSLNCSGSPKTLKSLEQGTIVFELRCRSSTPFLARINGSKLLAKAEMPWNDVVGIQKWVVMIPKDKYVCSDDVKPPAIEIAMKIDQETKNIGRSYNCGCMDCGCNYCIDYDLFALGALL